MADICNVLKRIQDPLNLTLYNFDILGYVKEHKATAVHNTTMRTMGDPLIQASST